jgi:dTDP-4-amino-4,6-dideoxygalactose transaminase
MSWVATTNAIVALGATPVFADVQADYTLDPDSIRAALSERTKAIVPVHFYGLMAPMPDIMELATDRGIPVVEDAAQAHGADIEGRPAGSFGDLAAFSLNPMKPLAALGEAGVVVTDRPDWAERLRSLRNLGTVHPETCVEPSLNHKIDALQAVVLRTRMKRTSGMVAARNDVARRYSEALAAVVSTPRVPEGATSAFFDYTIHCSDRDRLEEHLLRGGIEVKVRHRMLLPDQPAYEGLFRCSPAGVPMARQLVGGILSLPIHEALTPGQVDSVIEAVLGFYRP